MRKPSSWRELLETIISTSSERERIATAIGVRTVTLVRWSRGESIPRPQHLRQLLQALPGEYQDRFRELLEREGDLPPLLEGEVNPSEEIPFTFVNEVLDTRATTPDSLRFWAISRQVLQHAIRHLDPEPVGMAITVVRCMPPCSDGTIHSLRESAGLGTPPGGVIWNTRPCFWARSPWRDMWWHLGTLPPIRISRQRQRTFPSIEGNMK